MLLPFRAELVHLHVLMQGDEVETVATVDDLRLGIADGVALLIDSDLNDALLGDAVALPFKTSMLDGGV